MPRADEHAVRDVGDAQKAEECFEVAFLEVHVFPADLANLQATWRMTLANPLACPKKLESAPGTTQASMHAAGKFARMLICMRIWLGDRMFDRIILSQTR